MPENLFETPPVAEIPPASTTQKNEPVATAENPDGNSMFEKIGRAAAGVFERRGIKFRAGRGRPRADGQPKISDVPLTPGAGGPAPAATLGATAVDLPVDALFRRSVASAVKGVLSVARGVIRSKAGHAGLDATYTDAALKECEPEQVVMDDFSESLQTVLKKYDVKTDYAPEIALGVSVSRLGAPYWLLLKRLNEEIERKKAAELAAKK